MDYSKGGSVPLSDASDLEQALAELKNLYSIERKYSIRLVDAFKNPGPDMVEESDRDAAVRDLRLLRMWCELPHSVFFTAVNILDRFLTCMRVKIKYLECLAMSCFYLATWLEHKAIDLGKILKISYTKCSENDVLRMANIVKGKLSLVEGEHVVTGLDYLKVVMRMSNMFAEVMHLKPFFTGKAMKEKIRRRLEVLMLWTITAKLKPIILVELLIETEVRVFSDLASSNFKDGELKAPIIECVQVLLTALRSQADFFPIAEYCGGYEIVTIVIAMYMFNKKMFFPARHRCLILDQMSKISKPSENFISTLYTVQEL